MKRELPLPLELDCTNLTREETYQLAHQLTPHFEETSCWGDGTITAAKPLSTHDYAKAWRLIDLYGVKFV